MTTLARRNSSIHKVREYVLPKIGLEDEYEVVHAIQDGWRGRLLLVEHKPTRNEVVLKAVHKESTTRIEFFKEFHYNYYLSPHPNILNAYDVAFEADNYYVFAQEYAPFGDVTSNMSDKGLGEINTKKIALQLAFALDFMHSKELVHRDINMDNILVFKSDFSEIKLCDFGSTKKVGTLMKKKNIWLPYAPPEIVDAVQNEGYHVDTSQDVWQMGVLIYVLLTGVLPWQKADLTDPNYSEYINWRKRRSLRTPKKFSNFTPRLLRMFKRLLEPKSQKRSFVKEVYKYLDDKWLIKVPRKEEDDMDGQSVCYSTYSFHSCKVEKDRILGTLKDHGLETTVDRMAKRKRIHEWLERSLTTKVTDFFETEENGNDIYENRNVSAIKNDWPSFQKDSSNFTEAKELSSASPKLMKENKEINVINNPIAHDQREQLQCERNSVPRDSAPKQQHIVKVLQKTPPLARKGSFRDSKKESPSRPSNHHIQPSHGRAKESPVRGRSVRKSHHSPERQSRFQSKEREQVSSYDLRRSKTDSYFVTSPPTTDRRASESSLNEADGDYAIRPPPISR